MGNYSRMYFPFADLHFTQKFEYSQANVSTIFFQSKIYCP